MADIGGGLGANQHNWQAGAQFGGNVYGKDGTGTTTTTTVKTTPPQTKDGFTTGGSGYVNPQNTKDVPKDPGQPVLHHPESDGHKEPENPADPSSENKDKSFGHKHEFTPEEEADNKFDGNFQNLLMKGGLPGHHKLNAHTQSQLNAAHYFGFTPSTPHLQELFRKINKQAMKGTKGPNTPSKYTPKAKTGAKKEQLTNSYDNAFEEEVADKVKSGAWTKQTANLARKFHYDPDKQAANPEEQSIKDQTIVLNATAKQTALEENGFSSDENIDIQPDQGFLAATTNAILTLNFNKQLDAISPPLTASQKATVRQIASGQIPPPPAGGTPDLGAIAAQITIQVSLKLSVSSTTVPDFTTYNNLDPTVKALINSALNQGQEMVASYKAAVSNLPQQKVQSIANYMKLISMMIQQVKDELYQLESMQSNYAEKTTRCKTATTMDELNHQHKEIMDQQANLAKQREMQSPGLKDLLICLCCILPFLALILLPVYLPLVILIIVLVIAVLVPITVAILAAGNATAQTATQATEGAVSAAIGILAILLDWCGIGEIIQALDAVVDVIVEAITEAVTEAVGTVVEETVEEVLTTTLEQGLEEGLKEVTEQTVEEVVEEVVASTVKTTVKEVVQQIALQVGEQVGEEVGEQATGQSAKMSGKEALQQLLSNPSIWGKVTDKVCAQAAKAIEEQLAKVTVDSIKQAVKEAVGEAVKSVTSLPGKLGDAIAEAPENLIGSVMKSLNKALTQCQKFMDDDADLITTLKAVLKQLEKLLQYVKSGKGGKAGDDAPEGTEETTWNVNKGYQGKVSGKVIEEGKTSTEVTEEGTSTSVQATEETPKTLQEILSENRPGLKKALDWFMNNQLTIQTLLNTMQMTQQATTNIVQGFQDIEQAKLALIEGDYQAFATYADETIKLLQTVIDGFTNNMQPTVDYIKTLSDLQTNLFKGESQALTQLFSS